MDNGNANDERNIVHLKGSASLDMGAPIESDGYQPRAVGLLAFSFLRGSPPVEIQRLLFTAQRRCDTAHRQFTRVRQQLDAWGPSGPNLQPGVFLIGDAELAVIALHGAFECLGKVRERLPKPVGHWPGQLQRKKESVTQLRDAYVHIDARALGRGKKGPSQDALQAFIFEPLMSTRTLTYASWTLGIDKEATDLLLALTQYIQELWDRLIVP